MFSLSLRRYLALGYLVSLAQASCDNQAPLDPGRFSRIEYDYIIIGMLFCSKRFLKCTKTGLQVAVRQE